MSASAALQIALIAHLKADPAVSGHLGERIFDNAPVGASYPYLTLGPAQEIDDSADCVDGSECYQQLDIWTQEGGSQLSAKTICGAVRRSIRHSGLELADPYALVLVDVTNWSVIGDPDEKVAHGIVTVRALVDAHHTDESDG